MRSHEWIDQRSLALDRLIAKKIAAQPDLMQKATETLNRWIAQRQPNPPAVLLEWQEILRQSSFEGIIKLLQDESEEARRLRQSSPFCGIVDQEERLAVLRDYEATRA